MISVFWSIIYAKSFVCALNCSLFLGVWGSAFSILFKRLIQDRTKLSIDLSGCVLDESDDEEEEIFYDAVEEFQFEEDTLRDALGKHIYFNWNRIK